MNFNPRRSLCGVYGAVAAMLLGGSLSASAVVIVSAGFEGTADTWPGVTLSGSGGSFSTDTGSTDTPALQRILQGSSSFQTNNGTATVDFDPVDISGFNSVQLTLRVSSPGETSGNGNDSGDNVQLFVSLDGAPFSLTPDIMLSGNSNARYGYNATLTGTAIAGTPRTFQAPQGGTSTNNYSTLTITIPRSATSLDFRIVASNDNSGELWSIDAVTLSGTAVPEPSSMLALTSGLALLCGSRTRRQGVGRRHAHPTEL